MFHERKGKAPEMLYLSKEKRPTHLDAGAILGRTDGRTRERASGKRELRKGDSDKWGGKFPSGARGAKRREEERERS